MSAAELRYFTAIDHCDHEALIALSDVDGRAVGVARYVRPPHDPHAADVAVTVADDWHRRGLATALLTRLSERAVKAGIRRYTVLVAADNLAVLALMRTAGVDIHRVRAGFDTVEAQIALPLGVAAA